MGRLKISLIRMENIANKHFFNFIPQHQSWFLKQSSEKDFGSATGRPTTFWCTENLFSSTKSIWYSNSAARNLLISRMPHKIFPQTIFWHKVHKVRQVGFSRFGSSSWPISVLLVQSATIEKRSWPHTALQTMHCHNMSGWPGRGTYMSHSFGSIDFLTTFRKTQASLKKQICY